MEWVNQVRTNIHSRFTQGMIINNGYRGEVSVILINLGNEPFTIKRGERIAQMIVAAVSRVRFDEAKVLSATKRGTGGFGSTGVGATPSRAAAKKGNAIAGKLPTAKRRAPRPAKA